MSYGRILFIVVVWVVLGFGGWVSLVAAEEKSFYSPVIFIDKEKNLILISTSAKVFYIEASDAAKPHLDKLPQGVLVDFVVEMRGDQKPPLLKSWSVKGGESACMVFDGKNCK